jgi:hypothetical protein
MHVIKQLRNRNRTATWVHRNGRNLQKEERNNVLAFLLQTATVGAPVRVQTPDVVMRGHVLIRIDFCDRFLFIRAKASSNSGYSEWEWMLRFVMGIGQMWGRCKAPCSYTVRQSNEVLGSCTRSHFILSNYSRAGHTAGVRFSAAADFPFSTVFRAAPRVSPASYSMGTGSVTPKIKRQGRPGGQSSSSSSKVKNCGVMSPFPHTPSWCDTWAQDNFTATVISLI